MVRKSNREKVWERDGYKCRYCGVDVYRVRHRPGVGLPPYAATVDHVIPKSKVGSTNNVNNLVTACKLCNAALGAKFDNLQERVDYIHSLYDLKPDKDWGGVTIKVISIDPGKTTGVVMATLPHFEDAVALQVTDTATLFALIDEFEPDIVLVEQFILWSRTALQLAGSKMYSSEIIGALQTKCTMIGVPIVFQQAYQKDTISEYVLKHLGLHDLTVGKPHARDAAKHLARYCWDTTPDTVNDILKSVNKVSDHG